MSTHLLRSPLRTLLAGTMLAASAIVLSFVGSALGVPEPWPVLLIVGASLLLGVPRARHAVALAVGATIGLFTEWLGIVVLPDTDLGVAMATAIAVLTVTVVTAVTSGQVRFGLQLVGWAVMTASSGSGAGTTMPLGGVGRSVGSLLSTYVTVLIAAGLGLLVAQVAQLLAMGVRERRVGGPLPAVVLGAGLAAGLLVAAPVAAQADTPSGPVVQHQQLVVGVHAPDGTPTRGLVVSRVGTSGAGEVRVELRDQAIGGLRHLSEPGVPDRQGTTVTHRLGDGASVRTTATLARALPVAIEVAYLLDGAPIAPAALVGRSGRVEATYTVTNRTAESQELRFFDARGRARTVTRDVAVPFAGVLDVAFDDRFAVVRTVGGDVRTDVTGRQRLSAELVLFAPLGAPVQVITWTAEVQDAVIPGVGIRLAPVGPVGSGAGTARIDDPVAVLRDLVDAGGLVRTGLRALDVEVGAGAPEGGTMARDLLTQTTAILEGLLDTATLASAEQNEARALVAAQEARRRAGDGLVHPLLREGPPLLPGVRVETGVAYVLEVAGIGDDGVPPLPLRFVLAIVLLVTVGLLGRTVGVLTGADDGAALLPDRPRG